MVIAKELMILNINPLGNCSHGLPIDESVADLENNQ
jgi:hypothetical protein